MNYGDIYWVDFGNSSMGHEYIGRRPALIIQSNQQLKVSNLVTVMPLTSQTDNCQPDDISIKKNNQNSLHKDSVIKVHHIESFDKNRFIGKIGEVDASTIEKVKQYLKIHFSIDS
ncbi:MAG: type II toxin-antitoxin system PemK/MazF family toxin [Candidatus Gribaldobacteria bacterium]|nr:type II toxin-antitoxin system PemK/MazF family toxin [Candidatus Gribaldobacteria bacterium]